MVGIPLAVAAIGCEAVMAFGPSAAPAATAAFHGHAGFIVIFALLNVAFLHSEVARQLSPEGRGVLLPQLLDVITGGHRLTSGTTAVFKGEDSWQVSQ